MAFIGIFVLFASPMMNRSKLKFLVLFTVLGLIFITNSSGQGIVKVSEEENTHKGQFYFYWGWNRAAYTPSDINFKGPDYNFTLANVRAKDRQTPFQWDVYFNPGLLSIPQYNMRFGYFFWNNYEVSFGVDHMKYVMIQDQSVTINGKVDVGSTRYDKSYVNDSLVLSDDFLIYEHTDGLNFLHFSLRRYDDILKWKFLKLGLTEGVELGAMMPRTNCTILGNARNDEFHFAGYGIALEGGLKFRLGKYAFIQTEGKLGHTYMWDIRTTSSNADGASQSFVYAQWAFVMGFQFKI